MKVLESAVSLTSEHNKKHEIIEEESLTQWSRDEDRPARLQIEDRVEFEDTLHVKDVNSNLQMSSLDAKLQAIIRALESLTGEKMNLSFLNKLGETAQGESPRVGWGIEYNYEKQEIREESLNFSAQGNLQTEDGRDIDFALAFSMQSRVESYESFSLKAGDALIDPLVVNFGSDVVSMTATTHEFDLDLDGKSDRFSFVGDGSGFLVLDKNRDSKVNDGSELFGPKSGNGFSELRAYDSDQNGWIDESDDVFKELLIWTKDEEGKEELFKLSDKNIGALYLGSTSTSFDMRDEQELKAQLKESSIYLKEDGSAGTLQEIDLVV